MINNDKWINSLPNTNLKHNQESVQIDNNKWVNTIPKKNSYNIPKKNSYNIPKKNSYNSVKKYSFVTVMFVCGLLLVSVVKNQTRNLEKDINYLKASIGVIEFNLKQAILDNEVITSPGNISKLAKEYLNDDLKFYKKSQIKNLNGNNKSLEAANKKNINKLQENVKTQIVMKINKKKEEIQKLQELYNNPKSIPVEIKTKVAKQIQEKKFELKNLYKAPKDVITLKRVGKWGAVQVVKAVLGIPMLPGR